MARVSKAAGVSFGLLCMLAVAAGVAGCGAGRRSEFVAVPTPTVASTTSLHYPLDAYQPTPRDMAESWYLYRRTERDCMRKSGYNFLSDLTTQALDQQVRTIDEFNSRRYGITDLSIARKYGYQLSPAVKGPGKPGSMRDLPSAQQQALAACLQQAARVVSLDPSSQADAELVDDIGLKAFQQTEADPRVKTVFTAWSRCMTGLGYAYTDPYQAAADRRFGHDTAGPSAFELAIAQADISCKAKTNLVNVAFRVEADHQNAAIGENRALLERVKKELATQEQRLATLMAPPGPSEIRTRG